MCVSCMYVFTCAYRFCMCTRVLIVFVCVHVCVSCLYVYTCAYQDVNQPAAAGETSRAASTLWVGASALSTRPRVWYEIFALLSAVCAVFYDTPTPTAYALLEIFFWESNKPFLHTIVLNFRVRPPPPITSLLLLVGPVTDTSARASRAVSRAGARIERLTCPGKEPCSNSKETY